MIFAALILPMHSVEPKDASAGLSSYARVHPDVYDAALELFSDLKGQMAELGFENPEFALSIVFPELMRYSMFKDELETLATQLMYTAGPDSEGCSLGFFQMKPIFAESVEVEIAKSPELKKKYSCIDFGGDRSTFSFRSRRIRRIRELKTQCAYLYAFMDICTQKFSLGDMEPAERLCYLATAYNAGFSWTKKQLESLMEQKSYPNGSGNSRSKWNYSRISLDFYLQQTADK